MIDVEETIREVRRALIDLQKCVKEGEERAECENHRRILKDARAAMQRIELAMFDWEWAIPIDPFPAPQESWNPVRREHSLR